MTHCLVLSGLQKASFLVYVYMYNYYVYMYNYYVYMYNYYVYVYSDYYCHVFCTIDKLFTLKYCIDPLLSSQCLHPGVCCVFIQAFVVPSSRRLLCLHPGVCCVFMVQESATLADIQ